MGVDAGGDAFEFARELNEATEAQKTVTQESLLVLQRASEMSKRYEARITEQARLLGVQGKRIAAAINCLDLPVLSAEKARLEALSHLRGDHD